MSLQGNPITEDEVTSTQHSQGKGRNLIEKFGMQVLTGIAKAVFLITLFLFGGLSFFTPFGPLYPVFVWILLLNDPMRSAGMLGVAFISGFIGMCINLKKRYSGVIGFLGGALAGPFWVWFFLLAKRSR